MSFILLFWSSTIFPLIYISFTVILFWVNVPVLSEHITDVHPKVSTAGSFLTKAFLLSILDTPSARATVTIAASPSGIAATAKDTPSINISPISLPLIMPSTVTTAHITRHITTSTFPSESSFSLSGDFSSSIFWRRSAILPISVFIPISKTLNRPLPFKTFVPIKPVLLPLFTSLLTPTDSPVNKDSSITIPVPSINSPSAGILSPASNTTISPIVKYFELITLILPSLYTLQVGAAISFSASNDFSVLNSWKNPRSAFTITIISIVIASAVSPIKPDIIVAPISTHTIKSLNCANKILIGDVLALCSNSLSPKLFNLFSASFVVSPGIIFCSCTTLLVPPF